MVTAILEIGFVTRQKAKESMSAAKEHPTLEDGSRTNSKDMERKHDQMAENMKVLNFF